jgi:hypothetical protein
MAVTAAQVRARYAQPMPMLKKLFWAYFLLLIFEGALRKWIIPPLSAPLLLIRDPIALMIIFEAYRENKWPEKWSSITGILTAGLIGIGVLQLVAVGNPWFAAVYGLRSYLLPFPVAFIMGENLDQEDLRKFGVAVLWILLPMTLLEIAQYRAPAGSFLNKGAYEGAEQIRYVGERVRASGTFSFVTGPMSFAPLAAAFVFYGFVNEKLAPKWLLWASAFALVLSVPVVGSRTVVVQLASVVLCAAIGALCGVSQLLQTMKVAVPLLIISFLVTLLPIFSRASVNLHERFAQASGSEGSVSHAIKERTVGSITDTVEETDFFSNTFGAGMGSGAAAISKLTQGRVVFLSGEGEFSRALWELGPFPGLFFMMFRLFLAVFIAVMAIGQARHHEPLALVLVPLMYTTLFFAVLEQPTEQGFMVIGLAFSLAALKRPDELRFGAPQIAGLRFNSSRSSKRPIRWSEGN